MATKAALFTSSSSSDDDEEDNLRINKEYAKSYEKWRRKEEIQKAESRGQELSDSSSEDSEDEGYELNPKTDLVHWRCLAAAFSKKPLPPGANVINDSGEDEEEGTRKQKKKGSPMLLKDYERAAVEKGGFESVRDDEEDEDEEDEDEEEFNPMMGQGKESIRKEFMADDSDSDDDGGMIMEKVATKEHMKKYDESHRAFLKGEVDSLPDKQLEEELRPMREHLQDPSLDPNLKFVYDCLLSYDLNKGKDASDSDSVPHEDLWTLEEDAKFLEEQEEHLRKYNFRHEQGEAEEIKSYPRKIPDAVRLQDTRRKERRERKKERKKKEKEARKEELRQLAKMRNAELEEKIEKIRSSSGNPKASITSDLLDEDFDPAKYDAWCRENIEDNVVDADSKKPTRDDDIDEDGKYGDVADMDWYDSYGGESSAAGGENGEEEADEEGEDPHATMDCEFDEAAMEGMSKRKLRRLKRMSRLQKAILKKKPSFNKEQESFDEYVQKHYDIDCEDVIAGGVPTRFHYREVVPNSYGLTDQEIICASDSELNQWCSLKKVVKYRTKEEEMKEVKVFRIKGRDQRKKLQKLPSILKVREELSKEPSAEEVPGKKKRKKKKKQNKAAESSKYGQENSQMEDDKIERSAGRAGPSTSSSSKGHIEGESVETEAKKKRKKKKKKNLEESHVCVSEEPVAKKRKMEEAPSSGSQPAQEPERKKKKKKKKKKKSEAQNAQKQTRSEGKEGQRETMMQVRENGSTKNSGERKSKQKLWNQISSMSAERLKAYGITQPKKLLYQDVSGKKRKKSSAPD